MELKNGYTTGTCAAIAAKAAARMLFENKKIEKESLFTPKGVEIYTAVINQFFDKNIAECAVVKYAGDDPDVTNGMQIFARVCLKAERGISVDGGKGVGRVTKKGLQQNIGEAAINAVPKQMITDAVREIFDEYSFDGGADVIISVPGGEEIAKKTFNPQLGIEGGISILGTSGIVEPMSEQAIIDTIKVQLDVKRANEEEFIVLTPGNYGADFIDNTLKINLSNAVKCSNFIGETLDFTKTAQYKGVLLVGHIGKLIKLAGGIMNTHSKNADSRLEIIAANAACETNDINLIRQIMNCTTTEEAVKILLENGICGCVMKRIITRAEHYVNKRLDNAVEAGIIMFSNEYGILAKTENADKLVLKMGE